MLKRIGAFTLALLITAFAVVVWWILSIGRPLVGLQIGPTSLRVDGPPFLVAAVLLAGSVILLRRCRSVPVVLLSIGSSALFIARLHDIAVGLALDFEWEAARKALFGFGCLEDSRIATPIDALRLIGFLIPVGALCYFTGVIEKHLTRRWSERPAALTSRL
jgi:hypothetical protein